MEGMLYLHSHGILHRDLTLANLLLTRNMNVVSFLFLLLSVIDNNAYMCNLQLMITFNNLLVHLYERSKYNCSKV